MHDIPDLSPLLSQGPLAMIYAGGCIVLLSTILVSILLITRRRQQKTLASLSPAPSLAIDLTLLKSEYLEKIDAIEHEYRSRTIYARVLHQQLSTVVRQFASHATQSSVATMTLADLKRSRHTKLVPIIEGYYAPEFSVVENGNVDEALAGARKVVSEWSS